jgi:hypothetical protein
MAGGIVGIVGIAGIVGIVGIILPFLGALEEPLVEPLIEPLAEPILPEPLLGPFGRTVDLELPLTLDEEEPFELPFCAAKVR